MLNFPAQISKRSIICTLLLSYLTGCNHITKEETSELAFRRPSAAKQDLKTRTLSDFGSLLSADTQKRVQESQAVLPTEMQGEGVRGISFLGTTPEGRITLDIPIIIFGADRVTPTYFEKVFNPILGRLKELKHPIEGMMDQTDSLPRQENFSKDALVKQLDKTFSFITRIYQEIGVDLYFSVSFQDIGVEGKLSQFEETLLNADPAKSSALLKKFTLEKLKNQLLSQVLHVSSGNKKANEYRNSKVDKNRKSPYYTFIIQPFPDLVSDYVPTPNYNITLNEPSPIFAHEFSHFLFLPSYEGYTQPYSPVCSLMNSRKDQIFCKDKNYTVHASPFETVKILNSLRSNVKGIPETPQSVIAALDEKITQATLEIGKLHRQSLVGMVSFPQGANSTYAILEVKNQGWTGPKQFNLMKADWPILWAPEPKLEGREFDQRLPVLAQLDDTNNILSLDGSFALLKAKDNSFREQFKLRPGTPTFFDRTGVAWIDPEMSALFNLNYKKFTYPK